MKILKTLPYLLVMLLGITLTSCKEDKKENVETTEMDQKAEEEAAAALETQRQAELEEKAKANSIASKAMASSDLDTLVTALKAAGLDSMMMEEGEYTVFAPTDNGFSKLKKGQLDELLKPESKEMLTGILQYHVVQGKVLAKDLTDGIKENGGKYTFNTVNGEELTAMMDGDQIVIKDGTNIRAHILQGNIEASNGIVHKIDKVLLTKG
ncbi:fasciclin domain-containing protein [Flavimarina sp. Hel_I_48]|uniref:fasciclin domain-containing protein n=1 Tax=Flavimarina sp. Hel_I_48 TaxID=1392488 RepID=UPI0004DF267D|nr:fasciclin domain-containing protein [Flavimarina sp. Hel_I_48]